MRVKRDPSFLWPKYLVAGHSPEYSLESGPVAVDGFASSSRAPGRALWLRTPHVGFYFRKRRALERAIEIKGRSANCCDADGANS